MKLIRKFLVTGADSPSPNPRLPHDTLKDAIYHAKTMMHNRDFVQSGAIIWRPVKALRFKEKPVEILNPEDVTFDFLDRPRNDPLARGKGQIERKDKMNPSNTLQIGNRQSAIGKAAA